MAHKHIILLLSLLAIAGLSPQIYAGNWKVWPGYRNYSNITAINWNGEYNNFTSNSLFYYNVGRVDYLYVTLANVVDPSYIVFSAYSSSNTFLGNVTGFYYNNGFLLQNRTRLNSSSPFTIYSKLTAFYNPNATTTTTCTTTPEPWYITNTCSSSNFQYNNYFLTAFEANYSGCGNPIDALVEYKDARASFGQCTNTTTYFYKGYTEMPSVFGIPYLLLATNQTYLNFTFDYQPYYGGTYWYRLNSSNTISRLTNFGTFRTETLNASPVPQPLVFIAQNTLSQYQLLDYNLGVYGVANAAHIANATNGAIFNDSNTLTHLNGAFFNSNMYDLKLYYKNATSAALTQKITYLLFPAYSTNYTSADYSITGVVNPIKKNTPTNCGATSGWFYCFQYRILLSNMTWQYVYDGSTLHNFNISGSPIVRETGVMFTIVNVTHYFPDSRDTGMGVNCQDVYMDEFDNTTSPPTDLGQVRFWVLSCNQNTSTASFLVWYQTSESNQYPSKIYLYFGYPAGFNSTSFNNGSVAANWRLATDSRNGLVGSTDALIQTYSSQTGQLDTMFDGSYLHIATCGGSNDGGIIRGNIDLPIYVDASPSQIYGSHSVLYSNYPETTFFYKGAGYGDSWLLGSMIGIYSHDSGAATDVWNNAQHISGPSATYSGLCVFWNMTKYNYVDVINLYSVNYTKGSIEYRGGLGGNYTNHTTVAVQLPNSNKSIVTNGSYIGNQTTFMKKYGGNTSLMGISMPQYELIAIGLLCVLLIVVFIASGNEFLPVIGLVVLWAAGLMSAFGGVLNNSYALTVVALLSTLIYVVMNAPKWFK